MRPVPPLPRPWPPPDTILADAHTRVLCRARVIVWVIVGPKSQLPQQLPHDCSFCGSGGKKSCWVIAAAAYFLKRIYYSLLRTDSRNNYLRLFIAWLATDVESRGNCLGNCGSGPTITRTITLTITRATQGSGPPCGPILPSAAATAPAAAWCLPRSCNCCGNCWGNCWGNCYNNYPNNYPWHAPRPFLACPARFPRTLLAHSSLSCHAHAARLLIFLSLSLLSFLMSRSSARSSLLTAIAGGHQLVACPLAKGTLAT